MITAAIYGYRMTPMALVDEHGTEIVLHSSESNKQAENLFRSCCTVMGMKAGISLATSSAGEMKRHMVKNSVSLAWYSIFFFFLSPFLSPF